MTIQDVIERLQMLRSEHKFTNDFILQKINEIEWKIKREIIDTHEGGDKYPFDGYNACELNVKLIAPAPYSELYIKWVLYQFELVNNAMVNASNSYALFNNDYSAYSLWYTKNNMPISKGNIHSGGYNI
ncbi:MAG: hypothetical protein IKJ88_05460 [Clostridia bacterium]|nr:hypothetical protein [Clostridia bacterium]